MFNYYHHHNSTLHQYGASDFKQDISYTLYEQGNVGDKDEKKKKTTVKRVVLCRTTRNNKDSAVFVHLRAAR